MTTREITKQQFSDGTTIDSDRLDKMNSEVADYVNNVPQRSITNKWVPTRYVWGYAPWDTSGQGPGVGNTAGNGVVTPTFGGGTPPEYYVPFVPWLPVVNNNNTAQPRKSSSTQDTPTSFTNRERYKGYLAKDSDGTGTSYDHSPIDNVSNQYSWEVGWSTGKPQLIKEISVVFDKTLEFPDRTLLGAIGYSRDVEWETGPDAPVSMNLTAEAPLSSVVIEVLVLAPTNPAERKDGFVVWSRSRMRLEGERVCGPDPNGAITTDYLPTINAADQRLDGLWFRNEDLDISIPAGAQVFCAVILPDYQFVNNFYPIPSNPLTTTSAYWSPMTDTNQSYTISVTCLEETENYE